MDTSDGIDRAGLDWTSCVLSGSLPEAGADFGDRESMRGDLGGESEVSLSLIGPLDGSLPGAGVDLGDRELMRGDLGGESEVSLSLMGPLDSAGGQMRSGLISLELRDEPSVLKTRFGSLVALLRASASQLSFCLLDLGMTARPVGSTPRSVSATPRFAIGSATKSSNRKN